MNNQGISEGATAAAVTTVAGKDEVITITPNADGEKATGFIICRSAKGGTDVREMVRIPKADAATTVYRDLNLDLPGTAQMLLLSKPDLKSYALGEALGVSYYPLYPTAAAQAPFLVLWYGTLMVIVPKFNALIKNIGYKGGLY